MGMKYKAVLFDFDDTLGDREKYAYAFLKELIDRNAPHLDSWERECALQHAMLWDENSTGDKALLQKNLKEKYGIESDIDLKRYMGYELGKKAVLVNNAVTVLKELKKKYKLGLVTNGESAGQYLKIKQTKIAQYFDGVIVSGDFGYNKPDPRLFEIAADNLGVSCKECIFVGDLFQTDIIGAHRAGMKPIWLWSHGHRACSVQVERISSIEELPSLINSLEESF